METPDEIAAKAWAELAAAPPGTEVTIHDWPEKGSITKAMLTGSVSLSRGTEAAAASLSDDEDTQSIPWRPIAELPDELKDGREVLLWSRKTAVIAEWRGDYWTSDHGMIGDATHFAEITPPESIHPVEALRHIAQQISEETGYPVDHESFDQAKAKLDEAP